MYPYITTEKSVTVYIDGQAFTKHKDTSGYDKLIDAIRDNDMATISKIVKSEDTFKESVNEGKCKFDGETLYYDGEVVNHSIVPRLRNMWIKNFDISPFLRFMENLMENPSKSSVDQLYGFLEACNLPITPDGHFLAYKMIRKDWMDCHTGTIDNSVGETPSMRRNMVDENPNRTCSKGLHCCSESYLGTAYGGYSSGLRKIAVKVNPRDVVAVPNDYNNSKMRICKYLVLQELPFETMLRPNYVENETDIADIGTVKGMEVPDDLDFGDDEDFELTNPEPKGNGLTEEEVIEIDELLIDGELGPTAIGRMYNRDESTIRKIRDGKIWSHVTNRG